jgi:hypothetical protein
MTRRLAQLAVSFALAATPAIASADETTAPPTSTSYAYQTFIADSAALTTLIVGLSTENVAVTATGLGAYALAAPTVHVAHARWASAAGAFALRAVGVPMMGLGGLTIAMALCLRTNAGGECSSSAIGGSTGGLIAGAILASTLDFIVLAREPDRAPTSRSTTTVHVAPTGLSGTF